MYYVLKNKLVFILLSMFVFSGCVQEPTLYTWNDYVNSSHEYGIKGEYEALERHLEVLEEIIEDSKNEKKRVAPGIYAEYAQMLFENNQKEKARKYFELEKQTYSEATVFIDRVIKKLYGEIE